MPADVIPVTDEMALEDAFARSYAGPVLLFNFDPG